MRRRNAEVEIRDVDVRNRLAELNKPTVVRPVQWTTRSSVAKIQKTNLDIRRGGVERDKLARRRRRENTTLNASRRKIIRNGKRDYARGSVGRNNVSRRDSARVVSRDNRLAHNLNRRNASERLGRGRRECQGVASAGKRRKVHVARCESHVGQGKNRTV